MSFSKPKKTKLAEEGSGRDFQEWWTQRYGMINKRNGSCVVCSESVVCRGSSVKRHYESNHSWLFGKSEDEQKEHISREIKKTKLTNQFFCQVC